VRAVAWIPALRSSASRCGASGTRERGKEKGQPTCRIILHDSFVA
jgi:hypothetical protein